MEPNLPPPPFSTPPITATTGPLPPPPQPQPQPQPQMAPPLPQLSISPPPRMEDSSCKEPPTTATTATTATTTTTTTTTPVTTTATITTATPKLRLMCSYGGHIVPRPYDKSLSYVGGDTRIIVVERHTSLSELQFLLSKSFLNGNLFALKYQLPTEDLDSLISVASEEDLEHMVEEYDRLLSSYNPNSKFSRIRLFLFTLNFDPENSPSIESYLGGSKTHDWFFTALNWNSSAIKKRPSVNRLLGLDNTVRISAEKPGKTLNVANGSMKTGGKAGNSAHDIRSVAESPTSSFSSSSSSSATSTTLQVEERGASANSKGVVVGLGVEEKFQQMNVVKKEEEPQLEQEQGAPRLEQQQQGAPRLEQQQEAPRLQHVKPHVGSDLSSPESVTSDIDVQNPMSRQNSVVQEDYTPYVQSENGNNFGSHISIRSEDSTRMQMQQFPESGYVYPSHFDHQYQQLNQPHPHQFVPAQAQYIQNHQTGTMPIYYSVYPPPQQPHYRPSIEHPYPVYYMPPHPQMPPPASAGNPDLVGGGVYRMPAAPPLQAVQVPATQPAPENGGFSRIYLPPQAQNPPGAVDYAYKIVDPANGHVYYSQTPPHLATQYQTVAPSPAATLSEVPPPRLSTEKH